MKANEALSQVHQKNLIKGIIPIVYLADKVIQAKQVKKESVLLLHGYDLVVDALALLGNSVYDFSMKQRELSKPEVAPAYKSLCHKSQPITTMLFGTSCPKAFVIFHKWREWRQRVFLTSARILSCTHKVAFLMIREGVITCALSLLKLQALRLQKTSVLSVMEPTNKEIGIDKHQADAMTNPKVGGRLRDFTEAWRRLTNDPWVINADNGYKIEFSNMPVQHKLPSKIEWQSPNRQWNTTVAKQKRNARGYLPCKSIYFKSLYNPEEKRRASPGYKS